MGSSMGVIKGDARSLGYGPSTVWSSCRVEGKVFRIWGRRLESTAQPWVFGVWAVEGLDMED